MVQEQAVMARAGRSALRGMSTSAVVISSGMWPFFAGKALLTALAGRAYPVTTVPHGRRWGATWVVPVGRLGWCRAVGGLRGLSPRANWHGTD